MKLSVVILTKNEEKNIEECIVKLGFCDEIIVVDDHSQDDTAVIADRLGAKVYLRALNDDFALQRNFGLSKAKGGWVLFIDADERLGKDLAEEIKELVHDPGNCVGAYMIRKNNFLGKTMHYGEFGKSKLLRMGKKGKGLWKRKVHEYWDIKGETIVFNNYLEHASSDDLNGFINKLNRYSTLHAIELEREGKRSGMIKILIWPVLKFINNYIFKAAFRDGTYGFVNSTLMSMHSFLAWSKLWLMQKPPTQK